MTATPPTDPAPDADQAAARWLVRRQDGLAPDETAEFEAWLAAAPAHRAALERLEGTWRRLDTLPAADTPGLRAGSLTKESASDRIRAGTFSEVTTPATVFEEEDAERKAAKSRKKEPVRGMHD